MQQQSTPNGTADAVRFPTLEVHLSGLPDWQAQAIRAEVDRLTEQRARWERRLLMMEFKQAVGKRDAAHVPVAAPEVPKQAAA